MLNLIIAVSSAAMLQAPTAAPARPLKDLPGVTITYYDVKGKDAKTIEKSLKKAATDPATKQFRVVRTNWGMGANITKRTTNGVCTIVGAKADFTSSVTLPRLTDASVVPAAVLASWQTYVNGLEASAAESLWTAYSQIPELEQSLTGKKCEDAAAIWDAGVDRIKLKTEEALRQKAAPATPAQGGKKTNS
jgi:predicted secreted Zn-dependent protease